jgi:hypothetical protein
VVRSLFDPDGRFLLGKIGAAVRIGEWDKCRL